MIEGIGIHTRIFGVSAVFVLNVVYGEGSLGEVFVSGAVNGTMGRTTCLAF